MNDNTVTSCGKPLPAIVLQHFANCLHDQVPDDEQRAALAGQMSDIMTPEDGADFREMCE